MLTIAANMVGSPRTMVTKWLIWITAFSIATAVLAEPRSTRLSMEEIKFTQEHYNATIPENSVGRTFVTPVSKMGIYVPEDHSLKITYHILDAQDDLFKVEEYLLGDFYFLLVRTHTSSYGRINRELQAEYHLTIQAQVEDKDQVTFQTTADLTIFVEDMNDLQPLFDYSLYNVSVPEDTQLHTSIAQVSAYDGDVGINAQIYYSFTEQTNVFSVHPTSGVVTLTRPLNYILQKRYQIDILAQDRGPQAFQHSSKRPAKLTVHVTQVNFFAPDIFVKEIPNILEPDQSDLVLAFVNVEDRDIGINGKIQSVELLDTIGDAVVLEKGDAVEEYRVKLSQSPDRHFNKPGINITLRATDMGQPPLSREFSFYIDILDAKDPPQFTRKFYNISVEENAPWHTPLIKLPLVKQEKFVDLKFEIIDGNKKDLFKISKNSGLLSTSSSLDAEKVSNVNLKVKVYDPLRKRKSEADTAFVNITIIDNNDNAPKFDITDNISEIFIDENLPVGTSVFRISATDKDSNENGRISYSITNVKNVPFDIEPLTGVIRTTVDLDYETMRKFYKLNLRVSDWGTPYAREDDMVFTINLRDVNDNEPHFEKVQCQGFLSRDSPIGTEILILPAIDFDINDVIQYHIDSGNNDFCFNLNKDTAKLYLNCSLMNVEQDQRVIEITARDGKHASQPVTIEMKLVNSKQNSQLANSLVNIKCQTTNIFQRLQELVTESRENNAPTDYGIPPRSVEVVNTQPMFNNTVPLRMDISEALEVGSIITSFTAIDKDAGYNGILVYVIKTGDVNGHFKMDMYSGTLTVASKLDREIKDEYTLLIEVSDLGSPSLSSNVTVSITILDENDNAPKFEQDLYKTEISENIVNNATVKQMSAMDRDLGANAQITYTIVSDNNHFSINPVSGIISVNRPLDRERHPVYTVLIRAADKGSGPISLSSTATLEVTLTDVNDVVPKFTPDVYSVKIREDLPVGAVVTVVTAADTDEGKNGEVSYELVYGEDYFEIDSDTGVMRVIRSLDYEAQQVHNISVRAQDGGIPPLISVCFINIEVVDVNENLKAPVFENFFAHGYINENEPVGSTVMTLTAYDPDGDGVIFSIRDGTGLGRFFINSNGTITTGQVLDRETATHYWLTVYAQDHGLVPLFSHIEVYIEVKDTNDHIPMTLRPVYYGSVPEGNTPGGIFVTQIEAFDLDKNPGQSLTYNISRFDPQNYFSIDTETGIIRTSGKTFDREKQAVHQLEVTVSDNGEPALTHQTRVYVHVEDDNDNRPQFSERIYRINFPETRFTGLDIEIFQVMVWDLDAGKNGELSFDIKFGKDDEKKFRIHPRLGVVYATKDLMLGDSHYFIVRATDQGSPKSRKSTVRVRIEVGERLRSSPTPPQFLNRQVEKRVMEEDPIGHMVEWLQANDKDGDDLFYSIIEGDPYNQFYVGLSAGNLMVSRSLDWRVKRSYNLTVQVTDGVNFDNCSVYIHVINSNRNPPLFESEFYEDSFPESTPVGSSLLKVTATDADDDMLIYNLPLSCNSVSSLELFSVNPQTGEILVKSPLDREVAIQHNLTIMVSDQGVSPNRNFTRVTINLLDHNDHPPVFLSQEFSGRVFETAAMGTSVLQVTAADQDKGHNAEITYSIQSGNVGGVFGIDSMLGIISVAKELDRNTKSEYHLIVMATDKGETPMSNTTSVKIFVTISDNAPPRFDEDEYIAELRENEPKYTNVFTVNANCRSSIIYTLEKGNEKGIFAINPNSGVVYTKMSVDYEQDNLFNLTVKGTSIIHSSAQTNLLVHIIDKNDNAPEFITDLYEGYITESAKPGTVVLNSLNEPLVVLAKDRDANLNALLTYEIQDDSAKDFISIDPNTGAIRTVSEFDHEERDCIEFSVEVWDMGKPQQRTRYPAKVVLHVNDVNDSPPTFSMSKYTASVLLPTFRDVIVIQVEASDPDTGVKSKLRYDITDGNEEENFSINKDTGAIFVVNETGISDSFLLTVGVTDGIHRTETTVEINVAKSANSQVKFTKDVYKASIRENYAGVETLTVIQIADRLSNQLFSFHLLNGHGLFEIGHTSGVLSTAGHNFDREEISLYTLVVEVRHENADLLLKAHAVVEVEIEDENDNAPVFVNQPYHAVVVYDSKPGHIIKQVTAIDSDAGRFGQVIYSVKGRGDLDDNFFIDAESGQLTVMRPLSHSDVGKQMTLFVIASDKDDHPQTTKTTVRLTVISKAYPVFEQQVYRASIPEYIPVGASVTSLSANSPQGQKLIYTIVDGDRYGDFDVDFNIGLITVRGTIDFDVHPMYNLTVQATETISGLTTTAVVIVEVQDINNKAPEFGSLSYTFTVSEAVPMGASVAMITASDKESGVNGMIHYSLLPVKKGNKDLDWFTIDSQTGEIHTRKFLDRETQSEYSLLVEATDGGVPSISSTAPVKVKVTDLNDNSPVFDQPSYHCIITDQGERGQMITKVSASDPDTSSAYLLRYAIIGGNDRDSFQIDPVMGIISLSDHRQPDLHSSYELNITVSDGVFSSFVCVSITIQNSNQHTPRFEKLIYVAEFPENYGEGMLVTQVSATDKDPGVYGMITYTIPSDEMKRYFRVDADTGEVYSVQVLDREQHSVFNVPIAATDNGGRMTFTTLHIAITDQNDNVPEFLAKEYKKTLLNTTPANTTIMTIQAEDEDSGSYGDIVYGFSPGTDLRVKQIFSLDPDTGVMTLKGDLKDSVNEIFQFFIQASDKDTSPMKNNVPVSVCVIDDEEAQPEFTRESYSFFMLESDPISTVIATVQAESSMVMEYIIVPGLTKSSNNPVKFNIDGQGQISVAGELDMETTSSFTLMVQAQTLNQPPLVQQTTVNIRLMDVNDNCPYFESNPYRVSVPENSDTGLTVIKVIAHDEDRSSKLSYSFGDDMLKYSHLFGIDSSTGVISLLAPLDREEQELYNLTVVVKDSEGIHALTNSTRVHVKVMDINDNPPLFIRSHYQAAVHENAYEGTILRTLTTSDRDIGLLTDTRFYIIDGDILGKFNIRKNGDLFVNRPLDREVVPRYKLTVVATDGAFVTMATVTVDILDANDNSPVCNQPLYEARVREDVSTSNIVRVKATDADEYGSIHYELTGDGAEQFSLEPNSGVLTAAKPLDRETIDFYKLSAKAVDSGGKWCDMEILITVIDVNDNKPVFSPVLGSIMLSEDSILNTLVYRTSATDADLGINRQLIYSITDSDVFKIDEKSGLIQLAIPLDRETTPDYKITVMATDQGTPQLSSLLELDIKVLDVNDNPPEFENTAYLASVPEDANPGYFVVQLHATSRDTGINAKISYYIQAGNDKNKFTLDQETGKISVIGSLDRESIPGYVLTVRAQDHGETPLSNTAYVQINVTDINDNPPVFLQKVYNAMVRENVQMGSKVKQVLATDLDSSPENKAVNYSIIGGDHLSMFDIHPTDGTIIVRTPLDRESVSSYVLHVKATNHHLMAETMVNIEVLDANDSPPRFTEDNYTVFVQEDKQITSCILDFDVTDDDLDPNGPPFTFDIIEGDGDRRFRVDTGKLCIAGNLNRQVTASYELMVRVFDNGTPAMFSDVQVVVSVIEESTFSPEVSNIDVSISSYLDEFPGGVIGSIKAVDADQYDTLTFKVVSPNNHLFEIDKNDGRILAFAGLDSGEYLLNISVTDGKFTTYGQANVEVNAISEDMIANSVTIQIQNVEAQDFIKNYKRDFQKVLKRELNVRARDIEIISIQSSKDTVISRNKRDADNNLDVLFAVKKGQEYIPQQKLKRKVARAVPDLEATSRIVVIKVFSDICEKDMCEGGQCIGFVEFDKESLVPVMMDGGSFVAAKHRYTYECECPNGNVGDNCLLNPTSCAQNPCPLYKLCSPDTEHGYKCTCPQGKTGRHCQKDLDNKCDNTNCHRGDTPITFSGNSYAMWTLNEPIDSRLSLSLRIKTRKESSSIMYAKGRVDYSILEVINGMIQYRFDCGSGEGVVMVPNYVSDGKWHTVMVERRGNQAEIFLDGQFSAITSAPGINDVLNLDTSDVYFGAEVETYANGYIDIRKGFRGCIEDIRIYNVRLPASGSNAVAKSQIFQKVEFSCKDSDFNMFGDHVCSNFPCMNGGACENTGPNSYICRCSDRYRGAKCEIDMDPCQRQPCLNNGVCENIPGVPNEYVCKCPGNLKGHRCEFGRYCLPNPCNHVGTCIEGPESYQCLCKPGYSGERCKTIVNACESSPCQNKGNCVQEGTTYYCNCSSSTSGRHCEDVVLPSITSNSAGFKSEEIYIILGIVGGLLMVVLIFVFVRVWRRKKNHQRRGNVTAGVANDGTEVYLNLLKDEKNSYKAENTLKVDNMNNKRKNPPSPKPPPVPDRPASYTPSGHDSINTLNNFDSLRNYGSAADELENIPNIPPSYTREFLQTFAPPRTMASIQPTAPGSQVSDSDSMQKENWESACQNILQNYMADKHSDKTMSKLMPIGTVIPMSHITPQEVTSFSSLPVSDMEDDLPAIAKKENKGYHWDASDWAPEKSLPNISEIPSGECPDSPALSSPHSNESNTHINTLDNSHNMPGEYFDSEYVDDDSEFTETDMEDPPDLPNYEEILAEQSKLLEDYDMPSRSLNVHVHPDYYLPLNSSFTSEQNGAETQLDDWPEPPAGFNNFDMNQSSSSSDDDNDSVIHYGFPPRVNELNRLSMITTDSDLNVDSNRLSAAFTTDSDFNGGYNRASAVDNMSDISGLCEIEDSEVNLSESEEEMDENTPLQTQRVHTEV